MKGPAASPAFASARTAVGFVGLLLALLALPWGLAALGVPSREQLWRGVDDDSGPIAWVWQQVFRERSDLDVVFVGASLMGAGVDTPRVEAALSRELGREAAVVTLAVNWRTEDRVHLILEELLRRRKVGLVVASMPKPTHARRWPGMSHEIGHWTTRLDAGTPLVRGMPLADRVGLAAAHVLTGPRSLLYALRPGRLSPSPEAANLGASLAPLGFTRAGSGDPQRYRPVAADPPRFTAGEIVQEAPGGVLRISELEPSAYQRHCIRETLALLARHEVPLAVLHLPGWPERADAHLEELADWSALAGRPVPVLGVPPAALFEPLAEDEVQRLFFNRYHLNASGSRYFTAALLPGILEVASRHVE